MAATISVLVVNDLVDERSFIRSQLDYFPDVVLEVVAPDRFTECSSELEPPIVQRFNLFLLDQDLSAWAEAGKTTGMAIAEDLLVKQGVSRLSIVILTNFSTGQLKQRSEDLGIELWPLNQAAKSLRQLLSHRLKLLGGGK